MEYSWSLRWHFFASAVSEFVAEMKEQQVGEFIDQDTVQYSA